MQRCGVAVAATVLLLLGACAGQPEIPESALTYATATPDAETLQQISAQAKQEPIVTAAAMSNADEVVCVREASAGSNIRVRRCYTRAQLNRQATRNQEQLADALSQSGTIRDDTLDDE